MYIVVLACELDFSNFTFLVPILLMWRAILLYTLAIKFSFIHLPMRVFTDLKSAVPYYIQIYLLSRANKETKARFNSLVCLAHIV